MDGLRLEVSTRPIVAAAAPWNRGRTFRAAVVWGTWLLASLSLALFVWTYMRNMPYVDDWVMVPVVTGHQAVTPDWLWAQHNEHRIVLPKLILVGLLRWIAADFRAPLYFNAALLSVASAMMIGLAGRIRGRISLADALLPLAIINPGQGDVLVLGLTMALLLSAFFSYVLIAALGKIEGRNSGRAVVVTSVTVVLLPLCGGSGLAMVPPLLLWLVGYALCGLGSGSRPGWPARAFAIVCASASAMIAALYLIGYVRPVVHPAPPSTIAILRTALQFLSLGLWPGGTRSWAAPGVIAVALASVALARLAHVAATRPSERPRALGLAAILLSTACVTATIGVSRSGLTPSSGLAGRYVCMATPLVVLVYLTGLTYAPANTQRRLSVCLMLILALAIPGSTARAKAQGRDRYACAMRVERALRAGQPESRVIDLIASGLWQDRGGVTHMVAMLRSANFAGFGRMGTGDAAIARTAVESGASGPTQLR
ncbi:hypothetical protein OJF2_52380 [Aquisphaera giovannonii]|uniref:Glycosyltransferase RgtA/B/C/D-like domain-containing protein n=1 Tax=Aquisphaera giovannonii TaxID=406548 RepID=A0A5B9W7W2_9BACT|nr:hypothetical protein [Aquisphaera giovannonii]QEH36653.1 hypothetical protein OJF2_52380 [Aquisphaera giovannonii]